MSSRSLPWVLSLVGLGQSACWPVNGTASDDAGGLRDEDIGGEDSGPESTCCERAEIHIDPSGGPVYTYLEAYPAEPTTVLADGLMPAADLIVYVVDPGVTVVVAILEDGSACARNQWELDWGDRVEWEVDSFPLEFVDNACAAE